MKSTSRDHSQYLHQAGKSLHVTIEDDQKSASNVPLDSPPHEPDPPNSGISGEETSSIRVVKCERCRTSELSCDGSFTCASCEADKEECVRRRRGFFVAHEEYCNASCERLHKGDEDKSALVKAALEKKRKREAETGVVDGVTDKDAGGLAGKNLGVTGIKVENEERKKTKGDGDGDDNEDKAMKNAIAYAYLADGNRTTEEILDVLEPPEPS